MTLTADHIQTIVAAIDAGWSPAELVADMSSGLNHFGLASINSPMLEAANVQAPIIVEEEIESEPGSLSGFYNQFGYFEADYDDETQTIVATL
jgi:hypothetical protein